eukprot:GHVS01096630.1.p1 GENE.GHVS01096630.1~~GHVS01096630.1.p1  ORF type:complete len:577 (+),score=121.54 GHVS01096630.1:295-2025(+)
MKLHRRWPPAYLLPNWATPPLRHMSLSVLPTATASSSALSSMTATPPSVPTKPLVRLFSTQLLRSSFSRCSTDFPHHYRETLRPFSSAPSASFVDLLNLNTDSLLLDWSDTFSLRAQCKTPKPLSLKEATTIADYDSSSSSNGGHRRKFDLCQLRRESKLYLVPIYSVLRELVDDFPDLQVRREGFVRSLQRLLRSEGLTDVSDDTLNTLFDAFDRNQNEVVDFIEMLGGLAQFCQGSQEDRIRAVFEVFDREKDGRLYFDEVMGVFCLIYRVVLSTNMVVDLKQAGVEFDTIDDLALCSTQEMFRHVLCARERKEKGDDECSDDAENEACSDVVERMLTADDNPNTCSIDTIDLEHSAEWRRRNDPEAVGDGNVRWAHEEPQRCSKRVHPSLQFHIDEGAKSWRVATAKRNLYLTFDEFMASCLKTPPAAGFSKSTLLRLPLIMTLREILAPPAPILWNCPVNVSRTTSGHSTLCDSNVHNLAARHSPVAAPRPLADAGWARSSGLQAGIVGPLHATAATEEEVRGRRGGGATAIGEGEAREEGRWGGMERLCEDASRRREEINLSRLFGNSSRY